MSGSDNQSKLRDLSLQLQQRYRDVEQLILEVKRDRNSDLDLESLAKIRDQLMTIKQIESQFAPLRDEIMTSGRSIPDDLREVVQSTIQIITRLIPDICEIEKAARESRDKLGPKIHQTVRGLKMQNAYHRT